MDIDQLKQLRRQLHRHPETAFCEIGTAARIEAALDGLPLQVRTGREAHRLDGAGNVPSADHLDRALDLAAASGVPEGRARYFRANGTALVVDLIGDRPGPRWGLRADMDALPIAESTAAGHAPRALGFAADNGAMHACGHDVHVAIGVGLLHRLSDQRFPGSLRVLFQPAEEGAGGAQTLLDAGVADHIDSMLGMHVVGEMAPGVVAGSWIGGFATRKLRISFTGVAAHAAGAPQARRNALLAAATAALCIMANPRYATADTRLNVGTLVAGEAANIVPASATMTCEARADSDDVANDLVTRISSIVAGAAQMQGVESDVVLTAQSVPVVPDDALVDRVVSAARASVGVDDVRRLETYPGSDDANLIIRHVQRRGGQGAYVLFGAGSPAPHHTAGFDVDERALEVAVNVLEGLVRSDAPTPR